MDLGITCIVYSDVCLRYRVGEMLLCTVMCVWGTGWEKCYCVQWCVSEVQGGRNVIVYSDVCLRYRVGEMLLCTVWGTEGGKCYWEQWRVSEVHSGRNVTVYSDVCLRYRVNEILFGVVIFVWCTGWEKCYCVLCKSHSLRRFSLFIASIILKIKFRHRARKMDSSGMSTCYIGLS